MLSTSSCPVMATGARWQMLPQAKERLRRFQTFLRREFTTRAKNWQFTFARMKGRRRIVEDGRA
jgi:hypothetical protein